MVGKLIISYPLYGKITRGSTIQKCQGLFLLTLLEKMRFSDWPIIQCRLWDQSSSPNTYWWTRANVGGINEMNVLFIQLSSLYYCRYDWLRVSFVTCLPLRALPLRYIGEEICNIRYHNDILMCFWYLLCVVATKIKFECFSRRWDYHVTLCLICL